MTGQEAIERIQKEAWVGRKPGLERTRALLDRLGNPERELRYVHITGTNGKGSTAAMTASILTAAGLRTGLYTSPHLWRFHERFQVDGNPIPDEALGRIGERVLEAGRSIPDPATEFELMTALGLLYFQEAGCDIVVLEVGLGGRLDSTNVIPSPEAAVITNIGLEHTQELGNTLAAIAGEKAGIIKPGCSTVLYHQSREVEEVVESVCCREGSPLILTAPDSLEVLSTGREGQRFIYRGRGPFQLSLLGEYQLYNAAAALETVWRLADRGWKIPERAVQEGLERALWPGRMELARRGPDLLLDGSHNPQCMGALRRSLEALYPGEKVTFLTGVLADKDYPAMMGELLPLARAFVTVTPDSPRALPARELAQYLCREGVTAHPCQGLEQGLELARSLAGEGPVCVCGSLYMIGEARHCLGLC